MNELEPMVFVVDDDDSVRKATQRLIRSVGMKVETFENAKDFLKHPEYKGACCLILDIKMPGLSGLDLQEELLKAGLTFPIIFMTGHGTVPMSVRAMKAGAIDFLEKPFEDQALLDLITNAIESDIQEKRINAKKSELKQRFESLTPREKEIFALVVTGKLNKQVASQLGISEKTVKIHRGRMMHKLGIVSVAELVRLCEKTGIAPAEKSW
jgi:FixJ family two-component response regulator